MKKNSAIALTFLVSLSLFTVKTVVCTTFCLKGKGAVLFGKNYDFTIGDGLLFVNKRGVSKVAGWGNSQNPAKWLSKYGSVTFNQFGRENPAGGMNEAGLVIELAWLDEKQYPKADSRPDIDVLEWIQYNPDTAAKTEEVIKNAEIFRIKSNIKLQYLVSDKAGNSAAVEFLGGKLVALSGENLPVSALTNDTYEKSITYARQTKDAPTESSLDRFTRAARKTEGFAKKPKSEKESVAYAFEILEDVASKGSAGQRGTTQWSIVYDQRRGVIYFRTAQNPSIKSVETRAFDYSCDSAVRIYDVNSKDSGDVTAKFAVYSRQANRDLIERVFNGVSFLKNVPAQFRDLAAAYPEKFPCGANMP